MNTFDKNKYIHKIHLTHPPPYSSLSGRTGASGLGQSQIPLAQRACVVPLVHTRRRSRTHSQQHLQ